jgi:hypothetical protein
MHYPTIALCRPASGSSWLRLDDARPQIQYDSQARLAEGLRRASLGIQSEGISDASLIDDSWKAPFLKNTSTGTRITRVPVRGLFLA